MLSHVWLWDLMDCSPPGSSVHWILQARILEWITIPFSRGSSWPKDRTCISCISCIAGGFFTTVPPGSPWVTSNSFPILQLPYLYDLKRNVFSIKSSIPNQIPHFPSKLLSHLPHIQMSSHWEPHSNEDFLDGSVLCHQKAEYTWCQSDKIASWAIL